LFRDLPELLSPAADGPVMGRGFSVSAGQQIGWITLGEKWQLPVRSRGRRHYSGLLRSRSGNPVYWREGGGWALLGLRVRVSGSGWWGCGVSLLVITRGTLASLVLDSLAEHRHVAGGRA
jgi:hypothetical protein